MSTSGVKVGDLTRWGGAASRRGLDAVGRGVALGIGGGAGCRSGDDVVGRGVVPGTGGRERDPPPRRPY